MVQIGLHHLMKRVAGTAAWRLQPTPDGWLFHAPSLVRWGRPATPYAIDDSQKLPIEAILRTAGLMHFMVFVLVWNVLPWFWQPMAAQGLSIANNPIIDLVIWSFSLWGLVWSWQQFALRRVLRNAPTATEPLAREPDFNSQRDIDGGLPWRLTVLSAWAVVGMAIIGVALAVFAYVSTPGVHDVPIYQGATIQTIESKEFYLFMFPAWQVGVAFVCALNVVRSHTVMQSIRHKETLGAPHIDSGETPTATTDYLWSCAIVLFLGTSGLVVSISRSVSLLGGP